MNINPTVKEAAGKSFAPSVNFRVVFAEVAGKLRTSTHREGGSREFFCTVSEISGNVCGKLLETCGHQSHHEGGSREIFCTVSEFSGNVCGSCRKSLAYPTSRRRQQRIFLHCQRIFGVVVCGKLLETCGHQSHHEGDSREIFCTVSEFSGLLFAEIAGNVQ